MIRKVSDDNNNSTPFLDDLGNTKDNVQLIVTCTCIRIHEHSTDLFKTIQKHVC